MRARWSCLALWATASVSMAQSVLFNFDNAPVHTSLPIDVSVEGVTAHLWANEWYYNYSVQRADTLGFTPIGFGGLCIYPNSVFRCDLHVSFDRLIDSCAIMYAVQDLYCDSASRMRLSAYRDGQLIASTTHQGGVDQYWPSSTISIEPGEAFDTVVLHHDSPPPGCDAWGPIFMADNMRVTITRPTCGAELTGDGVLDFFDVQLFLQYFAAHDMRADFTGDGAFDFFDVQEFLQLFASGCP